MRIHYPAVIVAAAVHWIAGGLWYGAWSGPFAEFIGPEQMKVMHARSEAMAFVLAFVSSLVLVAVIARCLRTADPQGFVGGLGVVFPLWLGFIAATQSLTVLFEGRHPGLYFLNVGYQLVACGLVVAILVAWRPRRASVTSAAS